MSDKRRHLDNSEGMRSASRSGFIKQISGQCAGGENDHLLGTRPTLNSKPTANGGSIEAGLSFRERMAGSAQNPDLED